MLFLSTTWDLETKAEIHVIKLSTGVFICWDPSLAFKLIWEEVNKASNHKDVISVQKEML